MSLPIFFNCQAHFHHFRVVPGHLDGVLVAQKIRGVEHEDVQAVGLDPLAAVDQAAQGPEGPLTFTPRASSMACTALIW